MRTTTKWGAALVLLSATTVLAAGTPGDLDATFGTGGVEVTTMNPYGILNDLAAQSDGKVVAVGQDRWNHGTEWIQWAIHRYDADGALDADFGTNGRVTLFGDEYNHRALGVALDGDGKILVTGNASLVTGKGKKQKVSNTGALVRLNTDGTLDSSFGSGGKAYALDFAVAVALQSDGKIVVAGAVTVGAKGKKSTAFALARFDADGDLDTTFGTDGVVVHDITQASSKVMGSGDDDIRALAIDSQDRILVTGRSTPDGFNVDNDQWLVRYDADGDLDTTFGTDGLVLVGTSWERVIWSHAIDASDRVVVSGYGIAGGKETFVARYGTSGALDSGFGNGGVFTHASSDDPLGGPVAIQSDGKIVVGVDLVGGTWNDVSVIRLTSAGALDTTFGTGGEGAVAGDSDRHESGYALVLDANGDIVVGGHTTSDNSDPDWFLARWCGS